MAYTQASSVSSDTTAFEQLAYFALRSQPMFEMVADVKSTNQSHPGSAVQFNIYNDLAQATSALTETSDVTAVALGDSTVTVTLAEYGNAVTTTAKLRGTSFLNVDADAANIIGYNMGNSIDKVVQDVLVGGSNVAYGGDATSTATVDATDNLDAGDIRKAVAALRGDSAPTMDGGVYVGFIHPDVSFDLRADTAVTDVIQYQIRQDGAGVRMGSIGTFGGVDFIETPRIDFTADAGATTTDVYNTVICGKQALAKAHSRGAGFGENPSVVFGPVTDSLRRFQTVGWYHLVGYSRFREASLQRIETSSSIGAN
ncbi:MAG: N4-gp56 family major capsid protein [Candidatus Poseidoniales archaeon]|jgi:N4-gp56 family major capsid protein